MEIEGSLPENDRESVCVREGERKRGERERVRGRGDNGCEMAPERSGRCGGSIKRLRD